MQHDGFPESLLYDRFLRHNLVIRNLGFGGDEITIRQRSENFGTPDEWLAGDAAPVHEKFPNNRMKLTNTRADVVLPFFGYGESFAGKSGVESFRQELANWLTHTRNSRSNGSSAGSVFTDRP